MPRLSHIFIYPIKSLDGVSVAQTHILPGGSLAHDREFVIVDRQGRWVTGKRTAAVHQLRSQFHLNARIVTLSVQGRRSGELSLRSCAIADRSLVKRLFWIHGRASAKYIHWVSRRSDFTGANGYQHCFDRAGCFLVSRCFF